MSRARILLADDHQLIRDTALVILTASFDVVAALADGDELIRAEPEMRPDVCVIDIAMPRVNGIEAAIQIRNGGSSAKIIFLSVHEDADLVHAALQTGAVGYVFKPRMATDLCDAVNGALDGRLFISAPCQSSTTYL